MGCLGSFKKKYSILAGTNGFFTWTCPSKIVTNHPQSTGMCHVSSPSHKFPDLEDKEMVDTRRSGNLGSFLPRVMGWWSVNLFDYLVAMPYVLASWCCDVFKQVRLPCLGGGEVAMNQQFRRNWRAKGVSEFPPRSVKKKAAVTVAGSKDIKCRL